jgi:uncharacterized protein (DUF1697 family)
VNAAARHVAFLRAINVGGRSVVKMTDLRDAFTAAGGANATTFIASGNVIFDASPGDLDRLRSCAVRNVRELLDADPVIIYRTARELEALVDAAPFGALTKDPRLKLYAAFLAERPKRTPTFPLSLPKERLEAIGMVKGDLLIVSRRKPNGMYGFPNNWIENELGVTATARNWSTVTKIVALLQKPGR